MKLDQMVAMVTWPEVEVCLRRDYDLPDPPDTAADYELVHKGVLETLRDLRPAKTDDALAISIEVDDDGGGLEAFDVHCVTRDSTDRVALDFVRWEEILGMHIDAPMLERYSSAEIVAHCLHEITFWGATQEEIAEEAAELEHRARSDDMVAWEDVQRRLKS